jgi:outer membrane lipoprotein-sorting protein
MKEYRDAQLGDLLRRADEAPPLAPDFDARLWARIERETAAGRPATRPDASAPPLLRRLGWRRPVAVAIAVAVVTAVALLVGLPGTRGPQTVSAADVLDRALAAYSSLETWEADMHLTWYDARVWKTYHVNVTRRAHLVWAADGSTRETWLPVMAAGHRLTSTMKEVYDATTGNFAPGYDQETRTWSQETNAPLGPPDAGTVPGLDLGTTVRALASSKALTLDETVVDGRPAWTVTCTMGEMAGLPPTGEDSTAYTVLVDKQTSLLLGVDVVTSGRLTLSLRYRNVRVNEPLPEDEFTKQPPAGVTVKRVDLGFHRATLAEAATKPGVMPLVPGFVPDGYELSNVAVADRAVIAGDMEGVEVAYVTRHAFVLSYRRGFDALTVSTRAMRDPDYTVDIDINLESDQAWSRRARTEVPITSGAFAGVTARILVASTTSPPHLWAMKDGVLLTIFGAASAKELLAVAESLQVYPGPSPAAE